MRISRSEERPYLRQDRIELGLLPFRQGGQDLIGFQGIIFFAGSCRLGQFLKHGGNGNLQGRGNFAQRLYGDVLLPPLHLADVGGMQARAVGQRLLAVALLLPVLPQFAANGLCDHGPSLRERDYKYYLSP